MSNISDRLKVHLEKLANTSIHMSLVEYNVIANDILQASKILANLNKDWETIDTCPSTGQVWVYGGRRFPQPTLVLADGEHWRYQRDYKLSSVCPTHWQPFYIPEPPQ